MNDIMNNRSCIWCGRLWLCCGGQDLPGRSTWLTHRLYWCPVPGLLHPLALSGTTPHQLSLISSPLHPWHFLVPPSIFPYHSFLSPYTHGTPSHLPGSPGTSSHHPDTYDTSPHLPGTPGTSSHLQGACGTSSYLSLLHAYQGFGATAIIYTIDSNYTVVEPQLYRGSNE